MIDWLTHPVLPFVIATVLMMGVNARGRQVLAVLAPVASLILLLRLDVGTMWGVSMLGLDLAVLRLDELSRLFAVAFAVFAIISNVYAWPETSAGRKAAAMGLGGSGMGIVLAGDWLTLLLCWEWLTVSSLFTIWLGGTTASLAAGMRYLLLHLAGGVCFLAGIIMHLGGGGELITGPIALDAPGGWLMLIGMATNAAVVPLHAWLPDAYPRATLFGTVLISAFTTKAAVYALTRSFAGTELLVWAGCFMAIYGVVFAIMENNLRRLLGYHIVSQVGFMVAAIGMAVAGSAGEQMAVNGASLHAVNNILYKGLLLMSVGAIIYATGTGKLTDLGGLAKPLKWTMVFFIVGAVSIAGLPLFNGFISKAFILGAAGYNDWGGVEIALLTASMGTFLSVGLKITYFAFMGEARAVVQRSVPMPMLIAMAMASVLCFAIGVMPPVFYPLLPYATDYNAYTGDHVLHGLQLLTATALGFWILRHRLKTKDLVTRDVDRLYRGPLAGAVQGVGMILANLGDAVRAVGMALVDLGMTMLDLYRRVRLQSTLGYHAMLILTALALVALGAAWVYNGHQSL